MSAFDSKEPINLQQDEQPLKNNIPTTPYREKQSMQLCAKHAINHLLQEEKTVWVPNKGFLLTNTLENTDETTSAKDPNIKINLWNYCSQRGNYEKQKTKNDYINENAEKIHKQMSVKPTINDSYYTDPKYPKRITEFTSDLQKWEINYNLYGNKTLEEIKEKLNETYVNNTLDDLDEGGIGCNMSSGMLPFAWFDSLIMEVLGYTYVEINDENYKEFINDALKDPNFLGAIINKGGYHYISSPQFSNFICTYILADSLNEDIYTCYLDKDKDKYYKDLNIVRGYLVFADDENAYKSVAVKRMNNIQQNGGKKQINTKTQKHKNKKTKNQKPKKTQRHKNKK